MNYYENPRVLLRHKKMMTQGIAHAIRVTSLRGKTSPGVIRVQTWDKRTRFIRAFRILVILWGLAIVSILIPLAHFVLVPGLLISGPIAFFVVFNQERMILGGESVCPECQKQMPIIGTSDKPAFRDLCANCQSEVRVERLLEGSGVGIESESNSAINGAE